VPGRGERIVGSVGPALREQGYEVTVGALVPHSAAVPAPDEIDASMCCQGAFQDRVLPRVGWGGSGGRGVVTGPRRGGRLGWWW